MMLARRLADGLYVEAMLLADEARTYFDTGIDANLDAFDRVLFSCESLKVTTRLMHVIAWLLTQRAVEAGEMAADQARAPSRRLGMAVISDDTAVMRLPSAAQALIAASVDLFRRVERLDAGLDNDDATPSPARQLLGRLHKAF
jgi:regulator of CtrA degradation